MFITNAPIFHSLKYRILFTQLSWRNNLFHFLQQITLKRIFPHPPNDLNYKINNEKHVFENRIAFLSGVGLLISGNYKANENFESQEHNLIELTRM